MTLILNRFLRCRFNSIVTLLTKVVTYGYVYGCKGGLIAVKVRGQAIYTAYGRLPNRSLH